MKASALLLVVSSLVVVGSLSALTACGGDNKSPSPGPAPTSTPAGGDGGSSSTGEGPRTTSTGSGKSDGGASGGDAGYFAGSRGLPQ